jgi:flotillin
METGLFILIGVVALAAFSLMIFFVSRYKKCPSDKLLVVYGKVGGKSSAKTIHGGAAFIWPVIQDYKYLDLTPMNIDVNLENALSKQNIRMNIPSNFTIAISTEPEDMENAAVRLLAMNRSEIVDMARDIIFGQLRLIVAMMDIEEINTDREKFLDNINKNLEKELSKVGLGLINVNLQDIQDDSGYINALGQEAASKAINEANVSVAKNKQKGDVGTAEAEKLRRTQVATLTNETEVGEAEAAKNARIKKAEYNNEGEVGEAKAAKDMRIQTSEANAQAIEGENKAQISIAESNSKKNIKEAQARANATKESNIAVANAQKESFESQKEAEVARAEKDKATQYADVVIPAQIAKEKQEVDAEAEAEKIRRIAKGNADAIYAKFEAEARGIKEKMNAQAEGFENLVKAAGGADAAAMLMISENLPELVKTQVEAIKNIKIDKITVWDNGGNGNGNGSTANLFKDFFQMAPPLQDLFKQVGAKLPDWALQDAPVAETVENTETKSLPGEASTTE